MSRLRGGIFGRLAGKTGDLVFSQARGRRGTLNTVRQLVVPANPRTAAQQSNRGLFGQSVESLREAGISNIRGPFNRYVGQLPAFQSILNQLLTRWDNSTPEAFLQSNLGPLPATDVHSADVNSNDPFEFEVQFSEPAGWKSIAPDAIIHTVGFLSSPSGKGWAGGAYGYNNVAESVTTPIHLKFDSAATLPANVVLLSILTSSDGIIRGTTFSSVHSAEI